MASELLKNKDRKTSQRLTNCIGIWHIAWKDYISGKHFLSILLNMSKYLTKIDMSNINSSHAKIINLVGKDKRVLEFGCSSGFMSEVLKKEFNCEVVGIEIDNDDAKKAESYCQKVILGDIEQFEWCEKLSRASFDVAIFADVLEHLKDPQIVLKRTKDFFSKDGQKNFAISI